MLMLHNSIAEIKKIMQLTSKPPLFLSNTYDKATSLILIHYPLYKKMQDYQLLKQQTSKYDENVNTWHVQN